MKAYKAFDKDFRCRGYQFKEGETFETESASLCNKGFHACENPLDVLNYYDLTGSRFAEVDLDATDETHDDDSKRVGKRIHIKAELTLKSFIKAAIDFLIEDTKSDVDPNNRAKLASSGYGAQLASSGDGAQLASSGDGAKLASSGGGAKLASSGNGSVVMAAGVGCKAKAKIGSWIAIAEWGFVEGNCVPVCVKTAKIDGKRLKEDTYYTVKGGKFCEAE